MVRLIIIAALFSTPALALEKAQVLQAECAFTRKCDLPERNCRDVDQNLHLQVTGHLTTLFSNDDGQRQVSDTGFEIWESEATINYDGRTIAGQFGFADPVLFFGELREKGYRFSARSTNYELWELQVNADGSAIFTASEGQNDKNQYRQFGKCQYTTANWEGDN